MSLMGNIFNLLNKYSNDELDNAREHARKEWIKSGGKGDGAIIMKSIDNEKARRNNKELKKQPKRRKKDRWTDANRWEKD